MSTQTTTKGITATMLGTAVAALFIGNALAFAVLPAASPAAAPASTAVSCTDGDGGINITKKADVMLRDATGKLVGGGRDRCYDLSSLAEWYCSAASSTPSSTVKALAVRMSCAAGYSCVDGACAPISTTSTPTSTPATPTSTPQVTSTANLTVTFSANTPQGQAVAGMEKIVGVFLLTNQPNPGNDDVVVRSFNVDFRSSTIKLAGNRTLSIYDGAVSNGVRLGTDVYPSSQNYFSMSSISDANFTDVVIPAGTTKTFTVVLDTVDARVGDVLVVRLGSSNVTWSNRSYSSTLVPASDYPIIKVLRY